MEEWLVAERFVKIKQPLFCRNEHGRNAPRFPVQLERALEQPRHIPLAAVCRVGARAVDIRHLAGYAAYRHPVREHLHHRHERLTLEIQQRIFLFIEVREEVVIEAALIRKTGFPEGANGRKISFFGKSHHFNQPFGVATYFTPRMAG